jgi:RNA polymerase sigma factor (sigma-70 family)
VNPPARFGNDPVMGEARSDAEILARASKQPELFAVVFDRHFAAIHRYLERRVGRDAADELSGEVFRIAFERRSRFRPVHESALPWLYGLATNLVLKRWRGETRHLRALARLEGGWREDGTDLDGADSRIAAQTVRARLLEALASLPEGDRDVVVLVAWEEFSYEEVAVALEIPLGTVRSRLNRARRTLRELLGDIGNELVTVPCEQPGGISR